MTTLIAQNPLASVGIAFIAGMAFVTISFIACITWASSEADKETRGED